MATTQAGSDTHATDDHGHDHDHPAWLAHHFDTPEQQFDSGKLGIWLFLVTEVLFFSGMFCAYAIFRMLRPEVFEGCSQFLNTKLGAINTGVLLFSSLTMAWAVRCSQTEEHKKLTGMLAATLSCAMIFLGVKAIEYSHKWHMGLLPAGFFSYDPNNPHPEGGPNYLLWICAPFLAALIGVVIWLIVSLVRGNQFQTACAKPLTVVCASFFLGVGLGMVLESGGDETHAVAHIDGEHAGTGELVGHEVDGHDHEHADAADHSRAALSDPDSGDHIDDEHHKTTELSDLAVLEHLASDATNTGLKDDIEARLRQQDAAVGAFAYGGDSSSNTVATVEKEFLTPSRAGVFFSIYYCMTGVHAIHILGGIGVLVWLLVRSVRQDFNRRYFGPVDYVGLYWHLVDLIWIYLFPLLYLIR
ncbi:MAG: cytochrome oxidase subunit III [Pirellulaceae bacterium]|nr:cytochrome oxidase subunit III [Pirellulaceae bacterium]